MIGLRPALEELARELRERILYRPGTTIHPWVPGGSFADGKLMTALVVAENLLGAPKGELAGLPVRPEAALLEWLGAQGVRLMVWHECEVPVVEDCWQCLHVTEASERRCRETRTCSVCRGEHRYTRMVPQKGWIPDGRRPENLLADYHGVTPEEIEKELKGEWAST